MGTRHRSRSRAQSEPGADIYRLLSSLDGQLRGLEAGPTGEAPSVPTWAGILFRVRRSQLLAPLDQIVEVLEPPAEITSIPGTRSWVVGVANNRGTLLPIFDLSVLVYGGAATRRAADRILVVRQEDLPCGLLVSEVIGIRHFEEQSRLAEAPRELGVLVPFADGAFPLEGEPVAVMALDRLLKDPLLQVTEM
jgi:twitching motility protein PilI